MMGKGTKLGEGKGNKLGEGEGSKLGEPCPKVRLRAIFLPPLSGLLRANVIHANVASRKSHSTVCFINWFETDQRATKKKVGQSL